MAPDILQTSEGVSETPSQKAEKLLLNLRKKMESAVTTEEKKKYSLLVLRLEETLADKTAAAKEGTKDVLAHFKSGLSPDQKSLLESAEKNTLSAVEKTAQETKYLAQSAEKALKNGDIAAGAVVVGAVMTKKTEGIIKRFSEAEGIEKLDVIREAGASIMEKIGQLFALILSFLSFDSSKIKDAWGNLLGIPKEVQEKAKKMELTKEKKEIIEKDVYMKISEVLTKDYGFRPEETTKDGKTKAEKLKEIIARRLSGIHDKFLDDSGVVTVDLSNTLSIFSEGGGLIYDLFHDDVIDASNVQFDFVNTAKGTVRYVAKKLGGVDLPGSFGGEISLDQINDNLSQNEKLFLMAVFMRKGGFVTEMIGHFSYIVTSPMKLLNTDTVSSVSTLIPGYDKKVQKMQQVIDRLEKILPSGAKEVEILREMKMAAENTKKAIEIVILHHKNPPGISLKDAQVGLKKLLPENRMDWWKQELHKLSGFDAFNKAYIRDVFVEKNARYVEFLEASLNKGKLRILEKIRSNAQFYEIAGGVNSSALYFKNTEALKSFTTLISQFPEFAKGFFTHAPVFIIGGVMMNEGFKPEQGILDALKMFIPIWGPISMIDEAKIHIDPKSMSVSMENTTEGMMGMGLIAIDGYFLTKATLKGVATGSMRPVLEFGIKPVVDIAKAGRALVRFGGTMGAFLVQNATKIEKALPKKGAVGIGATILGMLIMGGAYASSMSTESIIEEGKKKGLFDKEGNPIVSGIKKIFHTLGIEKQKELLDVLFSLDMSRYFHSDNIGIKKTEFKNSKYIIQVESEEQKGIIQKILLGSDAMNEFMDIGNIEINVGV